MAHMINHNDICWSNFWSLRNDNLTKGGKKNPGLKNCRFFTGSRSEICEVMEGEQ